MAHYRLMILWILKILTGGKLTMGKMVFSKICLVAAVCAITVPALGDEFFMDPTNLATGALSSDFAWNASLMNLKEIRLGQAAQSNSQNLAVKEYGKNMVRDYIKLNDRLMRIASAEGLSLPEPSTFDLYVQQTSEKKPAATLTMEKRAKELSGAQLDVQHIASLKGADFDRAYADAIVKGQQNAIAKFQSGSASLQDEQLKRYADRGLRVTRSNYDMALKLEAAINNAALTNSTAMSTKHL